MTNRYDLLLEGIYFCDLIFTGLPEMPRLGHEIYSRDFEMVPGANFYYALAFQRLGLRAGWPCDFGSDFFSRFVLEEARREGLDASLFRVHDYPLRHLTASLSFPDDRAFVTYMDEAEERPLAPLIRQYRPRCVVRSGLNFGPAHLELAAAARQVEALIFMDCQAHELTLANREVVEALQAVDIFAPNLGEALALTGASSAEAALATLAELTPLVILKLGAAGALARRGNQVVHRPAIEVEALDTTGAGDCFNAGFLYGYLAGYELADCLDCGNICGGLSTTGVGATNAPSAAQVETYLKRRYPPP